MKEPTNFFHYRLHIPKIDHDHLEIFRRLSEIGIQYDKDKAQDLYEFFVMHCNYEEELMKEYKFPYWIAHIDSHKIFLSKFKQLVDMNYSSNYIVSDMWTLFLDHVDHIDRQYAEWILENPKPITDQ
jgi:hemerythrin-like metal-binding protein